jgi:hypothetical protein
MSIEFYISRDGKNKDRKTNYYSFWSDGKPAKKENGVWIESCCRFVCQWLDTEFPFKNIKLNYGRCVRVDISRLSIFKKKVKK